LVVELGRAPAPGIAAVAALLTETSTLLLEAGAGKFCQVGTDSPHFLPVFFLPGDSLLRLLYSFPVYDSFSDLFRLHGNSFLNSFDISIFRSLHQLFDLDHFCFWDSLRRADDFRGGYVSRDRSGLHLTLFDGLVDKCGVGAQVFCFSHDGSLPCHVHRFDHSLLHHIRHIFPHGLLNLTAHVFRVDVAVLVFVIIVGVRRISSIMLFEEWLGRLGRVMEAAATTASKFARLGTTAVRLFRSCGLALGTHAQEIWLIRLGPLSITVLIFRDQSTL